MCGMPLLSRTTVAAADRPGSVAAPLIVGSPRCTVIYNQATTPATSSRAAALMPSSTRAHQALGSQFGRRDGRGLGAWSRSRISGAVVGAASAGGGPVPLELSRAGAGAGFLRRFEVGIYSSFAAGSFCWIIACLGISDQGRRRVVLGF